MVCARTALARLDFAFVVRAFVLAVVYTVAVGVLGLGLPATALAGLVFVRVPGAFVRTIGHFVPVGVARLWYTTPLRIMNRF